MNNIKELRTEMVEVFTQLKAEKIETKRAHELSNAAGKILGTVAAQLKYALQRGEMPNIDFLNVEETEPYVVGEHNFAYIQKQVEEIEEIEKDDEEDVAADTPT